MRVQQEEKHGCGVACVAMILYISYQDARKLWGKRSFAEKGVGLTSLDRRLSVMGFAVQRRYKEKGKAWPPAPWAEFHICMVDVEKKIPPHKYGHHLVVMDSEGTVFDPDLPYVQTLKDYAYVHNVAAVKKMPTRFSTITL